MESFLVGKKLENLSSKKKKRGTAGAVRGSSIAAFSAKDESVSARMD